LLSKKEGKFFRRCFKVNRKGEEEFQSIKELWKEMEELYPEEKADNK
jgi:hypothetical protein